MEVHMKSKLIIGPKSIEIITIKKNEKSENIPDGPGFRI